VTGVGVAGFTLGGGYSWKTNQYGLTIDTVQSFELVLPNGTVTTVTATSNADLFFGLKVRIFNRYSRLS
jgi:FAD/FMN-containing dehydrogenase